MNGTTKAPDAFPAPNQSQLESLPGLTPPQQLPAHGQGQIDLLFDEMDGSDNAQQEQAQAFDEMIMSSVPPPNVEAPEPWVPPPPMTFEDVYRQQDKEGGVELGPYSAMLSEWEHSMSGRS
ncbi:uncharacterized protein CLUP02_09951 [Colletotrichum lupini]|uniref:Uncharacterized protein n=1 Tax=Colletotrichum lupini TaxID=145971 RepID=A0A9Q8SVT8_9PEZI|nr:uncharacterized protein CLUP02_09951 [Colletotrichum lupini]UQC84454.1 hypothetical protein CLUP02_09951 [Colletotrichum lupini]